MWVLIHNILIINIGDLLTHISHIYIYIVLPIIVYYDIVDNTIIGNRPTAPRSVRGAVSGVPV